jgi:hypothetical protein
MEDRGRWGRELQRISEQVRNLPRDLQRSAAIRDWNPLADRVPHPGTTGADRPSDDSGSALNQQP